jgi:hypothetical protein
VNSLLVPNIKETNKNIINCHFILLEISFSSSVKTVFFQFDFNGGLLYIQIGINLKNNNNPIKKININIEEIIMLCTKSNIEKTINIARA